ncbi:MAG TPA: carbohydrate ABC transporter permease [Anaerolineales bacterium]|nr:carbohydrate ABC transporter permease [Anaerolineales bacterium]
MRSGRRQKQLSRLLVNGTLLLFVVLWTIPTMGIFISSFRNRDDIATSGWWNVFPHREWQSVREIDLKSLGVDPNQVMEIEGATGTFEEFRAGIETADGKRVTWIGNKRLGRVEIQEQIWTTSWEFSLDNYEQVLGGQDFTFTHADGTEEVVPGDNMVGAFVNSLVVAIPATVIPILIAAFAAYAFAWMKFPGRREIFIMIVALQVVPLQIALVPILRDYRVLNLNGTFLGIWLAHTGFGLALATFLLYNYISSLPREILESAFVDGASHFTAFTRLVLPLSVPALAAFAIFQFLWVWNDYLVALIFLGGNPEFELVTQRMAAIVGARGQDWHLLTAGAFVSMVLPLTVFFALQRYFLRGLLAGSVKG